MKNSTQSKNETQIPLNGMGTAPQTGKTSQSDISKKIEDKWRRVKTIITQWGKQLKFKFIYTLPKIMFDFKEINKMIDNRYEELHTPDKMTAIYLLWDKYKNWKKDFLKGERNYNSIPKFVYIKTS